MTTRKNTTTEGDIIAIGDTVESIVRGGEYYVLDIRDEKLFILNLKSGGRGEMNIIGARFLRRDNTAATARKVAAFLERWEEHDNPRPSTLVPGTVVVFKANDTRAAAQIKKLGWDPKTLLVVVKNSPKSVNLVPLGGHGDGLAYMRAHPSLLERVEMKTTR